MSSRQTHVITISFIALLGACAVWKSSIGSVRLDSPVSQGRGGNTPEDVIYAALGAGRQGDTAKYLENYSGPLRDALARAGEEMGVKNFQQSLRERNSSVKGIAVAQPESLDNGKVKAIVEYVYADRNEKQTYYLSRAGQGWKIVRIDGAESARALVPYGTPIQ